MSIAQIKSVLAPRQVPCKKPVKLICPACQVVYANCHPTEPCWCPRHGRQPVRLIPSEDYLLVSKATLEFFIMNGLPLK